MNEHFLAGYNAYWSSETDVPDLLKANLFNKSYQLGLIAAQNENHSGTYKQLYYHPISGMTNGYSAGCVPIEQASFTTTFTKGIIQQHSLE